MASFKKTNHLPNCQTKICFDNILLYFKILFSVTWYLLTFYFKRFLKRFPPTCEGKPQKEKKCGLIKTHNGGNTFFM